MTVCTSYDPTTSPTSLTYEAKASSVSAVGDVVGLSVELALGCDGAGWSVHPVKINAKIRAKIGIFFIVVPVTLLLFTYGSQRLIILHFMVILVLCELMCQ